VDRDSCVAEVSSIIIGFLLRRIVVIESQKLLRLLETFLDHLLNQERLKY